MNKVLSFVRLDLITIRPYLTIKNLLLFTAAALIMNIGTDKSTSSISFLTVYATIYACFPFAVGEKNGIDALYAILSIKRRTVVLGRYLFALTVDICAGLMAYVLTILVMLATQKKYDTKEVLITKLAMLVTCSIMQAVQLPVYRFVFGVYDICQVCKKHCRDQTNLDFFKWLAANPIIAALSGAAIWLGIMVISYQAACAYYNKRDF